MSEKITTGMSKVKIGDKKTDAKADAKARRRLSVAASTATKSYALDGGGGAAKGEGVVSSLLYVCSRNVCVPLPVCSLFLFAPINI